MKDFLNLKLPRAFVQELLECISINIDDWHRTKIHHETGDIDPDVPYIRGCKDSKEAGQFEKYYKGIKQIIESHIKE